MLIAGTERWKITIVEPESLRIALYVRDVAGLQPVTDPEIPPLDPSADVWPAWSRRPVEVPQTGGVKLLGGRDIDLELASAQWARWWAHALDVGARAMDDFRPPAFVPLAGVPDFRALMQRHYINACMWSEGMNDDPRIRHAHSAPSLHLNAFLKDLPNELGRPPMPFSVRITIIGVQTKRAWVLTRDHWMMTRHLVADIDNVVDWIRQRIRAIA
jgi:hypothetical protein